MPAEVIEFFSFLTRYIGEMWEKVPKPLQELIMKVLDPILAPIAWISVGAVFIWALMLFLRRPKNGRARQIGPDSTGFDPGVGIRRAEDWQTWWPIRLFYSMTGSDTIIIREMPYSATRNRTILSFLLIMASTWSLFGTHFFLTRIFPGLTPAQSLMCSIPYAAVIYLVDMSIIGSKTNKKQIIVLRVAVSLLVGILVSSPISVKLFSQELSDKIDSKFSEDTVILPDNTTVSKARLQITKLEDEKTKLEEKLEYHQKLSASASEYATQLRDLAGAEERGDKDKRLTYSTSGKPHCKTRCHAFNAQADDKMRIKEDQDALAAGVLAELSTIKSRINTIKYDLGKSVDDAKKSDRQNFLKQEHALRQIIKDDPLGRGFTALIVSLVIMVLDLLVLIGKTFLDTDPYYDYEAAREEVAYEGRDDFKKRVRPRPRSMEAEAAAE